MQAAEPIEFRRARDFSEVLNDTFEFIRQNFKRLVKDLLLIAGPFVLLSALLGLYLQSKAASFDPESFNFDAFFAQVPDWIAFFLTILLAMVAVCLVVYEFLILTMNKGTGGFQTEEGWQAVKKDFARLFFTYIGIFIVLVLAFLLLFIPGVYMFVILSILPFVRLYEGGSFFSSLSRSRQLVSGHWWPTLGLILVLSIIDMVCSFILDLPRTILGIIVLLGGDHTAGLGEHPFLTAILTLISSLGYFTSAIVVIGITFQFFSLVEKKEAAGLLDKVESLGQNEVE